MSYIRKVISDQEKLVGVARAHWMYCVQGIVWFAVLSGIGFAAEYYLYAYAGLKAMSFHVDLGLVQFDERHTPIPWIFMAAGFAVFMPLFLVYISTEVGLTNDRVIHKKGLFFIHVEQTDLHDIEAEDISHGWFGWLFGYGRVRLDCRFVDDMYLPYMKNPYKFLKRLHVLRMKHPDLDYDEEALRVNIKGIEDRKRDAEERVRLKRFAVRLLSSFSKAS